MDKSQAKLILSAGRPDARDAAEPQMREALQFAESDAELRQWLTEERASDLAIAAKLKTVSVPANLKATILAGKGVVRPAVWWRQPQWVALAASIVLLLGLGGLALHSHGLQREKLAREQAAKAYMDYTAAMADFLSHLDRLDYQDKEPAHLQAWLAQHQGHHDIQLTAALNHTDSIGCRVLDHKGAKVTLMCFRTGSDGWKDEMHLLVADRAALPGSPMPGDLVFRQKGQWTFASWSRGEKTYLLASLKGPEELKKHL